MTVIFLRKRGSATELRENFSTMIEADELSPSEYGDHVVWRWNSDLVLTGGMLEVNPLTVKQLSSDKPAMRRLATEQGVRIPVTYYTADEARNHFTTSNAPLLWRPKSHRAGQNMVVLNTAAEVTQTAGYWSVILEKTNEYRVYTFMGRVLGVDEKIVPDMTQLAWNHAAGGIFQVVHWDKWPSVLCYMATKISHAAGLHFAAVDMIKSDGRFYFLETNLSPAMTTVYKVGLLRRAVTWLESEITRTDDLPSIATPLPSAVKGYRNYIHPACMGERT